jgi:hypothetical protein
MTYIPPARIEARSAELWRTYGLMPNFDIERLLDDIDLSVLWTELHPEVLAEISPYERRVAINEQRKLTFDGNKGLYRFTLAHEIGHWHLHAEGARSGSGLLFDGTTVLCRDNERNEIETQAHRFAAALLAPRDELVSVLPRYDWRGWLPVRQLAEKFGMSLTAIFVRLRELELAHEDSNGAPSSGTKSDPNQPSLF